MGVNWQERKTERVCGTWRRQEGGAGDTGTARPCTAAAKAGVAGVGVADLQEAALGLAPGKLSMGGWRGSTAQEMRLYAEKLLWKVL